MKLSYKRSLAAPISENGPHDDFRPGLYCTNRYERKIISESSRVYFSQVYPILRLRLLTTVNNMPAFIAMFFAAARFDSAYHYSGCSLVIVTLNISRLPFVKQGASSIFCRAHFYQMNRYLWKHSSHCPFYSPNITKILPLCCLYNVRFWGSKCNPMENDIIIW